MTPSLGGRAFVGGSTVPLDYDAADWRPCGVTQKITDYIFSDGPSADGIVASISYAFWHEVQARVKAGRGFGQ